MTERQRILGIDPGSRLTGFGIVDAGPRATAYIASGAIKTADGEFPERLRIIFSSVSELVAEYRPDVVAVESVFMARNASSALKLGHARSAAICATFQLGIEVHEYAPRAIKQAIVGTGGASKPQVQHMVQSLLQLDGPPSADAADALATALCHAHQARLALSLRDVAAAGAT